MPLLLSHLFSIFSASGSAAHGAECCRIQPGHDLKYCHYECGSRSCRHMGEDRAINFMNEKADFVVYPKIPFLSSLGCWILGWSSLIFGGNSFPAANDTELMILHILEFTVLSLLGPAGVIMYSWQIKGMGDTLAIRKFFGIVHRKYHLTDIEEAILIPGRKRKTDAKIRLKFIDGLIVEAYQICSDFRELWIFLGGDEKNIIRNQ